MISDLFWGMRGLAIIVVAVVALSAMARGHQPQFVPRPTGRMPAVKYLDQDGYPKPQIVIDNGAVIVFELPDDIAERTKNR